ncbi:hypothetical protein B0H16DRAFT_986017 [Mycena metata]|uniref:GATA-type domain-containing protein n=1 Tax=Mycena metata TaxID=1033252 RepID=A0AAD7GI85_9AGAR|nr:hypothetical protein B0H16DRAFT_986017 [Mycena metata]
MTLPDRLDDSESTISESEYCKAQASARLLCGGNSLRTNYSSCLKFTALALGLHKRSFQLFLLARHEQLCLPIWRMRKRKHAALDDVAFAGDNSASSDSRKLRALPRRGRSRKIAAEPEDAAVTAGDADFAARARPLERPGTVSEVTDMPITALDVTSACVPNPTSKRRRVGDTPSAPLNPDGCTLRDQTSADYSRNGNDSQHTSPAPPAQSCGNCGSTMTAGGWTKSKLLPTKICSACYGYERRNLKCRPLPAARPSSHCCGNCGTHTSSKNQWADSKLLIGQKLCRPCFEYEKQHSKGRPLSLVQRARNRAHIVSECANCRSKTTADGWCSSVVHPASKLYGSF